jgi:hypothetical protein
MQIRLVEVKPSLVPVPGSRRQGYLAQFSVDNVNAWAVIVPNDGAEEELAAGKSVFVELQHDRLEDWGIADAAIATGIVPLEEPGDFRVQGKIWYVGEHMAAIVEAGKFAIDVPTDELPKPRPADGAAVTFTVRGLSLWESEDDESDL